MNLKNQVRRLFIDEQSEKNRSYLHFFFSSIPTKFVLKDDTIEPSGTLQCPARFYMQMFNVHVLKMATLFL